MGTMDLSINQEVMGIQSRFGNQVFKLNTFDETDVKGNNNLYNCRKTDTDSDSGSLFRDGYSSENLQVDPSLFSYSSFKKAMDLRTHSRMDDENIRTIFDDADYFAKNFFYKLLPITFEQVDEAIIHTEHNYSLFSLNSESETEEDCSRTMEDCSRTMDYSQIKKKNYKRRRAKFKEGSSEEIWDENEDDSNKNIPTQKEPPAPEPEPAPENSVQPLDLSTAPPVQEQKTDNHHLCHLKEHPDIREENLSSKLKCIQVTITRPDEKENYQPCDMFLNDIARLVPRLINNDCFEIDILDKTGDRHDDIRKHRLYYIIAESTWRLFQSTRERVILTNDHTLGPPVRKVERNERPTFLIFDQFSLAKCLAEYCEEIGGCFEYTCVEEGKESEKEEDVKNTKLVTKAIDMGTIEERVVKINAEETKVMETDAEKIQKDKLSIKSKEAHMEEVIPETRNHKLDDEDTSYGNAKVVEIKSEKTGNEYNFTESKPEKLENQKTKTGKKKRKQTKSFDVEANVIKTNAMEGKKIKTSATDSSLYLHHKERRTKKTPRKSRKNEKKSAVNAKKNKMDARSMKSQNIIAEGVKPTKIEMEKTETPVISDETGVIAVDSEYLKPGNTDTKETETSREDVKINLTKKLKTVEMKFENKKLIEENSKEIKADEIRVEEARICDREINSDEESVGKATKVQSRKRTSGMGEKKSIKKSKKCKPAVGIFEEEAQAFAVNAEGAKTDKDAKEKILGIKEEEADTREMKILKTIKRNRRGRKKTRVSRGDVKTKKGSQSAERAKKPAKLEEKSKIDKLEVEKTKNLLSRRRKKVKSESSLPHTVSQIKTRSKSTSESETSQKPNIKTQKPKNSAKESPGGVGRKEIFGRITCSGKGLEDRKQDVKVKENERGIRGRKRKMEEEERTVNEKCLRSRGGKEEKGKIGASGKRKKK